MKPPDVGVRLSKPYYEKTASEPYWGRGKRSIRNYYRLYHINEWREGVYVMHDCVMTSSWHPNTELVVVAGGSVEVTLARFRKRLNKRGRVVRADQHMGLSKRGLRRVRGLTKRRSGRAYLGMNGGRYQLYSYGGEYYEYVQESPWSAGPCFFLALMTKEGKVIKGSPWTRKEIEEAL